MDRVRRTTKAVYHEYARREAERRAAAQAEVRVEEEVVPYQAADLSASEWAGESAPPPRDVEMYNAAAERAVLACCLMSKVARDRSRAALVGNDFYHPAHETLWDSMNRLDRQGMDVDAVSLLSVVRSDPSLVRVVVDLGSYPVVPEAVDTHCREVRKQSMRRKGYAQTLKLQQQYLNPDADPLGVAAGAVSQFAAIRDDHGQSEDIEAMTVEELLLEVDEEPAWLIPGFLEEGDRFVLTGEEGLGKSHLFRQIVILASAGIDPMRPWKKISPVRGMVIDFENTRRQIRRRLRSLYDYAQHNGRGQPGLATVLAMPRSDITLDKTLNKLHRELDACQPQVLAIGPLYKMTPTAIKDDSDAGPILAALDTIRERGIALLIEAHAGHTQQGHAGSRRRDMRPRGSSALLGWPEFGYGMVATSEKSAVLRPWRGDREYRDFPLALVQRDGRWEEERPTTLADVWRPPQDWSDLEWAEGEGEDAD